VGPHYRSLYQGLVRVSGCEFSEDAFREALRRQGAQDRRELELARMLWRRFDRAAFAWGQAATPFDGAERGFDGARWDAAHKMLSPHYGRLTALRDQVRPSLLDLMCDVALFIFGEGCALVTSEQLRPIGVDDSEPED